MMLSLAVMMVMLTDLEAHVLRPFKVFHESETVSLLVVPNALETGPVSERPKGILPVP